METGAERQIQVRQVTHYQTTWTEGDRGADGLFTIQLILDQGVEEYVLRPTADDADVLFDALRHHGEVYFDMERKVLIFPNRPVGS
jgi:hypothetical protein